MPRPHHPLQRQGKGRETRLDHQSDGPLQQYERRGAGQGLRTCRRTGNQRRRRHLPGRQRPPRHAANRTRQRPHDHVRRHWPLRMEPHDSQIPIRTTATPQTHTRRHLQLQPPARTDHRTPEARGLHPPRQLENPSPSAPTPAMAPQQRMAPRQTRRTDRRPETPPERTTPLRSSARRPQPVPAGFAGHA